MTNGMDQRLAVVGTDPNIALLNNRIMNFVTAADVTNNRIHLTDSFNLKVGLADVTFVNVSADNVLALRLYPYDRLATSAYILDDAGNSLAKIAVTVDEKNNAYLLIKGNYFKNTFVTLKFVNGADQSLATRQLIFLDTATYNSRVATDTSKITDPVLRSLKANLTAITSDVLAMTYCTSTSDCHM